VIRPVAVYIGLLGTPVRGAQRNLMSWFGIRGIGSLYYLLYAINHHIERALAQQLLSITLAVVVASVVAHGVSVTPLMKRYEARKPRRRKPAGFLVLNAPRRCEVVRVVERRQVSESSGVYKGT
jgi:NhaP-type Na+/H+ or K+/H+ antiporter